MHISWASSFTRNLRARRAGLTQNPCFYIVDIDRVLGLLAVCQWAVLPAFRRNRRPAPTVTAANERVLYPIIVCVNVKCKKQQFRLCACFNNIRTNSSN